MCHSVMFNSATPARLLCPCDSPGKNTGMGGHSLLQGIFLTQGLKVRFLHLLNWQEDSLPPSHPEAPSKRCAFFICSPTDGQLGSHALAVVNNAAGDVGCTCLFELVFSFPLDQYPEMELLAHPYLVLDK